MTISMKTIRSLMVFALFCVFALVASASGAVNVVANVRGKKYEVTASTVEEFVTQVESLAGLEPGQQSVLFRGKVLANEESLEELGVSAGDVLNVLKGRKQRAAAEVEDTITPMGGMPGMEGMEKAMENFSPEDIQKSMKAMDNLLDSNFLDEYFGDDEKLEKARQQMLSNLDQYDQMMPGFKEQAKEIASDPEKWKEAMGAAKEQMIKAKEARDAMRKQQGGGGASGQP